VEKFSPRTDNNRRVDLERKLYRAGSKIDNLKLTLLSTKKSKKILIEEATTKGPNDEPVL
jgi:hypothetical protein